MGYNELELELNKILSMVERWRGLGYMPTIEQGVALERMQRIYVALLDMPCGEPAADVDGERPQTTAAMEWSADEDHEVVLQGVATAAAVGVVAGGASVVMDEGDDFGGAIPTSQEAEVEVAETESEEARIAEEKESVEDEPESEVVAEEAGSLDVEQDFAHEQTSDRKEPAQETEVTFRQEAEAAQHEEPTPAPTSNSSTPRIFGLEVSPYTRHEIIDTLFHGNTEMFEAEEAKIDAMSSLEEALVYIGETYHWIPDNAATVKFIDLLERRFDS